MVLFVLSSRATGADRGRYVPRLTVDSSRVLQCFVALVLRLWSVLMTDQAVKFAKPLCQVSSGKFAEMFKFT